MLPLPTDRAAQSDAAPPRSPAKAGGRAITDTFRRDRMNDGRAKTAVAPPEASHDAVVAAGMGVYDFDLMAGATAWSAHALKIYGGFDAPPTTVQLRARVHPLDWPKLYAARLDADRHAARFLAERTSAAGAPGDDPASAVAPPPLSTDVLHRIIRPDGALRWVRATGEYQFSPDGTPRRSVGVLRDVTEEMSERARLAAEIERGRGALAAAGLGTFDFDARTDAVRWDGATKRIFGLPDDTPDERPLAEVLELFHPEDREPICVAIGRSLSPHTGGRYEANHRIVRPDGAVRHVAWRSIVEFAEGFDGRHPIRSVGTVEDVTDRPNAPVAE
ncbi:PAS domain-containing protein [Alienimonas californiensis]|uniref:histidine kinase n=1 Tax=Alienimonas californiensis TaxID=2527989 RepID=A0A517P733_9PLAN|nr:PAS domain-containing protein [Alienimonas californiensis]QDT15186.1 putative diguanylate cyclase [Alienimonas californiensis]